MSLTRSAVRWGSARMLRRFDRSIPFLGAGIALIAIGGELRRKGVVRGALNTALDATPVVGVVKNVIEAFRGDFIPDRPARPASREAPGPSAPRSAIARRRP